MCCWNTMKKAIPAASQNRTETQKLYRHVQQISQRLDLQLQQALDWKEWFDVETLQLRQRVRDVCEHILLSGICDVARKTEEYLWRKAFYDIIQKLKCDKKALSSSKSLNSVYSAHLQAALGFYHQLLVSLRNRYNIPLHGMIDWIGLPQDSEIGDNITKEQTDWAFKACQRCLIYLGDIARYQIDILTEQNDGLAERYYHLAILLNPENGMPHNQIGTLKQNHSSLCESAYHYMRCILSVNSFEGSEENLKRVLEKHNQKVSALQEDALKNNTIIDVKTQFSASFLSLQEVLFGFQRLPTEDLAQWCQTVMSLFAMVLTNSLPETDGVSLNVQVNGTGENQSDENKSARISCALLVKMLGMNILDVVRLKKLNSEVTAAATAFSAALLSQLLDFISQYLKQTFPTLSNGHSDEHAKMKKRLLLNRQKRRRRRRRFSSHSSEHSGSEGSEDLLSSEDDLSDLSEGELDQDLTEESSEDSDSVVEEHSEDEIDVEVANFINPAKKSPPNGVISHHHRKKLSSLSKAGILLNKQLKKNNVKMHINSTSNGIIHDFVMEDIEFINQAAKLLDDFEKVNEEAYLPVIKIFFDWLKMNPDILKMSGKASPMLWQRVADVLNALPSQKVVQTAVMYFSQRRRLPLWLKGDLDDGIEHQQKRALPEDLTLFGAPGFEKLHHALDVTWFRGLSNSELYQFALRITYLRNFGHFICANKDVPCFTWDENNQQFLVSSASPPNHVNGSSEIHQESPSGKKQKVMAQRNEMMKALAKQKLQHEVKELEKHLQTTTVSPTEQASVYLVLDTAALCRHLSLLRSLVKSAQFVVIVPTQVIAALDEIKKYNPGARDAIKFLEDEIKHGNRWLKTQKENETVSDQSILNNRKKKNRDIEEWRFLHVVKCCIYFAEKHVGQSMVTLLTSDSSLNGGKTANMGTRPTPYSLEICENKGIRVEPVVDFYKRWTTRNGPS